MLCQPYQCYVISVISDSLELRTQTYCKPKPCKAYREIPVSQFSQGKTCFHYREPLFSLQGPCLHYRDFPVNPCTSLLGIAVQVRLGEFLLPKMKVAFMGLSSCLHATKIVPNQVGSVCVCFYDRLQFLHFFFLDLPQKDFLILEANIVK